ncbi:hypothetical protein [Mucilaginibacter lappiensis]|uniref:Mg2+ and Co2+ transporter CorA n=1 Tax=Mucilaginibacter lappiensis TaxID=354630 RepID=A0A841J9F7_9SPHI|nr:hypothetical protein [Mucilaginibacter lappiensis]MBB6127400.1 Mg2+ and Co2+ transporter CorA [Mucilaginibacter lappiensis]
MMAKLNSTVIYEFIVIVFLACWFLLTILNQFKDTKLAEFIRIKIDVFALIPLWTFFAPRPGKSDYHLLYRDKITEEQYSEWHEMDITEERTFWSWFWNPEKRDKKILSDVVQSLVSCIPDYRKATGNTNLLMFSMPYIIVLHAVSQCKKQSPNVYRQFMLAETSGYQETNPPALILLSVFHQI